MSDVPHVLVAAPPTGAQEVLASLSNDAHCDVAESFEHAARQLDRDKYDALVVGYYFDDARPFRIVTYARSRFAGAVPVILMRALALPLGNKDESEIRAAYRELGADDFIDFRHDADCLGIEKARERLRKAILGRLQSAHSPKPN